MNKQLYHFIDFKSLLLRYYRILSLTEAQAILLMKLMAVTDHVIDSKALAQSMTLDEAQVSAEVVKLIELGFIELDAMNGEFNLSKTYHRLVEISEINDLQDKLDETQITINRLVYLSSEKLGRAITAQEFELINNWVVKERYPLELIHQALITLENNRATSLNYADSVLKANRKPKGKAKISVEQLFENAKQTK